MTRPTDLNAFQYAWRSPWIRLAVFLLAFYLLYRLFGSITSVIVDFAVAFLIGYLANPLLNWLEKGKVKRGLGVVFVLLVCFLRGGIVGGIADLYRLVSGKRKRTEAEAEQEADDADAARQIPPAPMQAKEVEHPAYSGPILRATGLTKRYGGLVANSDIDFSVNQGELRGIIGPNGAGKSTLMKILYGVQKADEGTIAVDGQELTLNSPADAIAAAVGLSIGAKGGVHAPVSACAAARRTTLARARASSAISAEVTLSIGISAPGGFHRAC